jgi:hypothetical protein
MSKVLGVKEVSEILKSHNVRGSKPVMFGKEIEGLKVGEGLLIPEEEWTMKTSPSSYFYQKFNKKGDFKISCIKTKEGFLIVKK